MNLIWQVGESNVSWGLGVGELPLLCVCVRERDESGTPWLQKKSISSDINEIFQNKKQAGLIGILSPLTKVFLEMVQAFRAINWQTILRAGFESRGETSVRRQAASVLQRKARTEPSICKYFPLILLKFTALSTQGSSSQSQANQIDSHLNNHVNVFKIHAKLWIPPIPSFNRNFRNPRFLDIHDWRDLLLVCSCSAWEPSSQDWTVEIVHDKGDTGPRNVAS